MKATTESWSRPRSSRTTRGSRPLAAASFRPRSSSPRAFAELLPAQATWIRISDTSIDDSAGRRRALVSVMVLRYFGILSTTPACQRYIIHGSFVQVDGFHHRVVGIWLYCLPRPERPHPSRAPSPYGA